MTVSDQGVSGFTSYINIIYLGFGNAYSLLKSVDL
jgi:hypothetical protein